MTSLYHQFTLGPERKKEEEASCGEFFFEDSPKEKNILDVVETITKEDYWEESMGGVVVVVVFRLCFRRRVFHGGSC